jgi:ubiquinone/menaquinone biosynthesis C-methylase UbiE
VIRLLGVKRGDRVCDVGVGPGYFALRLARAVGPQGEVYAFDAEPRMLEVLRQRMREQGIVHVRPILAEEGVPPRPCDLVLVVNTFHHFRDGAGYLRRLAGHLKPGGRIANLDFHKRELPVGPPLEHKVAREDFLAVAARAGLRLAAEHEVLPYQYFLVLEPEAAAREAEATAPAPAVRRQAAGEEPAAEAPPDQGAEPGRRAPKRAAARKATRPARRRKSGSGAPGRRPPRQRAARRGSRR